MNMRRVLGLTHLQLLGTLGAMRNSWKSALTISLFLATLYALSLYMLYPLAASHLKNQYVLIFNLSEQKGGILFIALFQTFILLLLAGTISPQITFMLRKSDAIRFFHNRYRASYPTAFAATAESVLSFLLLTNILLAPYIWWPFRGAFGAVEFMEILSVQLLTVAVLLPLVSVSTAISLWSVTSERRYMLLWAEALAYVGLVFYFGFLVREATREPNSGLLFVRLVTFIALFVDGSLPAFSIVVSEFCFLMALFASPLVPAYVLRHRGI